MNRWLIILVFLFSAVVVCSAQVPTQLAKVSTVDPKVAAERLRKQDALIEQINTDSDGLTAGENRAFVNAKIGFMLWKRDPKTASAMFQKAVDDLVAAQNQAEIEAKTRMNRSFWETRITQSMRPAVLMTIAAADAKFALESLYRTRTGQIQRAIAQSTEPPGKVSDPGGAGASMVRNELNLEQRIMRRVDFIAPITAPDGERTQWRRRQLAHRVHLE